ncbi:uncharacterized protein LOC143613887 [Bidens hawaiensis]|uniref:uncharacterized protein LOC143613887 n=1 Tax=Bidens hawaiensis TaxID=980011 RepID=UPI00404B371C
MNPNRNRHSNPVPVPIPSLNPETSSNPVPVPVLVPDPSSNSVPVLVQVPNSNPVPVPIPNSNPALAVDPNGISLKDALCTQQRLLQKLYHELDVEREAAATAANEAMSMILRLQGEKAAVKMEAEQYKRLAEEKMNHAEESMETFEEIMYHKEMEIASLDYQVQAYRYRLLSLGFDDIGVHELKFPDNLLQRNGSLAGEASSATPPRRLTLPNMKKGLLERDRSIMDDPDMIAKVVEESTREDEHNQNFEFRLGTQFSSTVDITSYLEQIRELDEVVGQISGDNSFCFASANPSRCSSIPTKINEMDVAESSQKSTDEKMHSDSPSVCDVFEVPQIEEDTLCKDEGKSVFKDDEKVKKLPSFPQLPTKPCSKESPCKDEGKSIFKDDEKVNKLTAFPVKKGLLPIDKNRKVSSVGDGIDIDCHLTPVQANTTTEITSGETETVGQNVGRERATPRDGRELRLLYEINEKLDTIHAEIRSRKTKVKESSSKYDLPMLRLEEVC